MRDDLPFVDQNAFGRLLLRVEAAVNGAGWDAPAGTHLRIIYDARDAATAPLLDTLLPGRPVRSNRYVAHTLVSGEALRQGTGATGKKLWEPLRLMACNVAWGTGDQPDSMREILRLPGVLGLAVVTESWARIAESEEAFVASALGVLSIPDTPGSVEVRHAFGVDVHRRLYMVDRVRGRNPQLRFDPPIRGEYSTTLRIFADAARDDAPTTQDGYRERYPALGDDDNARRFFQSGMDYMSQAKG